MVARMRMLLVDRNLAWLQFAEEVLRERYDVLTAMSFEDVSSCCFQGGHPELFDLIFIGLDLATDNLSVIKSLGKQWRCIVMFPVFQEDTKLRVLFKAGVYDCTDKPYEHEGLLKLVEDELHTAKMRQLAPQNERKRLGWGVLVLESGLNLGGGT